MTRITIINGPNLNLLGKREPEVYGNQAFEDALDKWKEEFNVDLDYYQSNVEGDIVSKIQDAGFEGSGIVLNAGAYTHTSVAIADAVAAIAAPVIEVHISNVYSREEFRHKSYISPVAAGIVVGMGLEGYALSIKYLIALADD